MSLLLAPVALGGTNAIADGTSKANKTTTSNTTPNTTSNTTPNTTSNTNTTSPDPLARLLQRARLEVERRVVYDGRYQVLSFFGDEDRGRFVYPGGDVAPGRGVCTDVVVRAFRAAGLDLQAAVHEDIVAHPDAYRGIVARPDANIDHRRVGVLAVYFTRHGTRLPVRVDEAAAGFSPGDVVVWSFGFCPACKLDHIGLVSDRRGPRGLPLVLHNLGPHPAEDDALDAWRIALHVRHPLTTAPGAAPAAASPAPRRDAAAAKAP